MQREARIAQQVARLERLAIRADPQLAVLDLRLDARDSRRAIGTDRRDRLVPVRVEPLGDTRGELGAAASKSDQLGMEVMMPPAASSSKMFEIG
jgi:hypothetical protein